VLEVLTGPAILRRRWVLADGNEISTRALDLVRESTVIDMLGLMTFDWNRLFRWHDHPRTFGETDFRRLERPGIDVIHPAVETNDIDPQRGAKRWLAGWQRLTSEQVCYLSRIDSISDLLLAPRLGRIGVVVGFQNSTHFRGVEDVSMYYGLGQRVSQLTYNQRNALGSGCLEARDFGLTPFGIDVVSAMNRVGMAIDISHCGERTSLEAIAASRQPVLATHSNARALVPHQPRCKSDDVIRRLARAGGVIGMTMVRAFVRSGRPTLSDLLDHFDYAARLVGIEHVGIGSDLDPDALDSQSGRILPQYAIRGLLPEARILQVTDGLLRRGYAERDVALILGGNFQRVLAAIWPDASWQPVEERRTRRDPFCPAPGPLRVPPELSSDRDARAE
jgi:membrane dipeptidase